MSNQELEIIQIPATGLTNSGKVEDCWDEKPRTQFVDTIIIHSMWNQDGEGDGRYSAEECILLLIAFQQGLSAHYFIEQNGRVVQSVPEENRAWHAGPPSKMPLPDGREGGANMFSIGIELIGNETDGFTEEQYNALVALIINVMSRHPIKNILGHSDISGPEVRKPPLEPKTDPWNFNWHKFYDLLEVALRNKRFSSPSRPSALVQ